MCTTVYVMCVDGGLAYVRRLAKDLGQIRELTVWGPQPIEIIRRPSSADAPPHFVAPPHSSFTIKASLRALDEQATKERGGRRSGRVGCV